MNTGVEDIIRSYKYPGVAMTFGFELRFDLSYHRRWFAENWMLTFYASAMYVILVYVGVNFMKNRQPYNLRLPLTLWSLALAIFSILATIRVLPMSLQSIRKHGLIMSATKSSADFDKRCLMWIWLFMISKVPEFLDTFFIIARKQKLIFLHWYHHMLTASYAAFVFSDLCVCQVHCTAMNALVHSFMYSYYTLKAMKIKVPRFVSVFITTTQIAQMIIGTILIFSSMYLKLNGHPVAQPMSSLIFGCIVYSSFLILFLNFFIKSYLVPEKKFLKSQ